MTGWVLFLKGSWNIMVIAAVTACFFFLGGGLL